MTGLFLSEYVSRRDGWCINKCLGKLYRTFSLELWLCYDLKWICKNSFHLIRTESCICIECGEYLLRGRASTEQHLGLLVRCARPHLVTERQMSQRRLVRVVLGFKSPAEHVCQSTGAYLWVSSITQCGWYLYNSREPRVWLGKLMRTRRAAVANFRNCSFRVWCQEWEQVRFE